MTLTPRQQQCADLLAEGLSNKAIGKRLGISHNTVRLYLIACYAKGVQPRRPMMRGNRNATA